MIGLRITEASQIIPWQIVPPDGTTTTSSTTISEVKILPQAILSVHSLVMEVQQIRLPTQKIEANTIQALVVR